MSSNGVPSSLTGADEDPFVRDGEAVTARFELSGWEVELVWDEVEHEREATRRGPSKMQVRPALDGGASVVTRGLTSTVLRRLEELLVDATNDYEAQRPRRDIAALAAAVESLRGRSPRGRNDLYYNDLQKAYELMVESGSRRPVKDLAEQLGLKVATLKTQLLAARRRQQ